MVASMIGAPCVYLTCRAATCRRAEYGRSGVDEGWRAGRRLRRVAGGYRLDEHFVQRVGIRDDLGGRQMVCPHQLQDPLDRIRLRLHAQTTVRKAGDVRPCFAEDGDKMLERS